MFNINYKIMKVIFLITILYTSVESITINPNGPIVVKDYTDCMTSIININFKDPGLLVFVITKSLSTTVGKIRTNLLQYINSSMKYLVRVIQHRNENNVCSNFNQLDNGVIHQESLNAEPLGNYFIIIEDSYNDLTKAISRLIRSRNWNPRAKFLILLFYITKEYNVVMAIEDIFTCLFRFNVINVIVVVPKTCNVRDAIIYNWQPYDPPKYCGYYNETAYKRSAIRNFCEQGNLKHTNILFEEKVPHNMHGCKMEILAIERQPFISNNLNDANIEKFLVTEILRTFNMTPNFFIEKNSRGERFYGQWGGALKSIVSKQFQVLIGGIFPDFDVHEDFDSSPSYLEDSYSWVVPRAAKLPPWVALMIIFQRNVWLSVIIGFVVCALTWKVLGTLSGDSIYHKCFDHCFLNTWVCVLGFTTPLRPIKECLRVFFVFLNIYCIIFVTVYQTKLFDVLTNPSFEYQIANVEELVASGLKFGGFEELHDLFFNSSDPLDYIIGTQWVTMEKIEAGLVDVVVHRNFSVLCSRLELSHVAAEMPQLSDSFGNNYYTFPSKVFVVPMEMIAMKGFGLIDKFSKVLEGFKQNGIIAGIRRLSTSLAERRQASTLRKLQKEEKVVKALTIQHLQGGFLFLALGYVGGTLTFFIEFLMKSNFVQKRFLKRKKFSF